MNKRDGNKILVLTSAAPGQLLALACLFDVFSSPENEFHIRVYGQEPGIKLKLILYLRILLFGSSVCAPKLSFSYFRDFNEETFRNICLQEFSGVDFDMVDLSGVPTEVDHCYSLCRPKELLFHSGLKDVRGTNLYIDCDPDHLKRIIYRFPSINKSFSELEDAFWDLKSRFENFYYFDNQSISDNGGDAMYLAQDFNSDVFKEYVSRLCEGKLLYEFLAMCTKNFNLMTNNSGNLSTKINLVPFYIVMSPPFTSFFVESSFSSIDRYTLLPGFDDAKFREEGEPVWHYLNMENIEERQNIILTCLQAFINKEAQLNRF